MLKKAVVNRCILLCILLLVISLVSVGIYHKRKTDKILNSDPVKIYKVDKPEQSKSERSANIQSEDIETKSKNLNTVDNELTSVKDKVESSKQANSDIQLPDIQNDSDEILKLPSNQLDIPNTIKRLTREESIERMVEAGMPRKNAEMMQPRELGTSDTNAMNASKRLSSFEYGTKEYFDTLDEVLDVWENSHDPIWNTVAKFTKRAIDGKSATQWEIYLHQKKNSADNVDP